MTTRPVEAPFTGTIAEWLVEDGEGVHAGEELVIINIKNRSVTVRAETDGSVKSILHAEGEKVLSGWKLAIIEEIDAALSSLEDAMTKDSQFLKDIKKVVEDVVAPRFNEVNAKLDALSGLNAKVDALSGLNAKVDALSGLNAKVDALSGLNAKVDALSGLNAKVDALSGVDAKLDQLLAGQGGKPGTAPKPPKG